MPTRAATDASPAAAAAAAAGGSAEGGYVQPAPRGASPFPATTTTTTAAAAASLSTPHLHPSSTQRLHRPTQLHCQAAVVRIGEVFGEFACNVYRSANRGYATDATLLKSVVPSRKAAENGGIVGVAAAATFPQPQQDQVIFGPLAADALFTSSSGVGMAAPTPPANAEEGQRPHTPAVDDEFEEDVMPVDCIMEGIPRWQLLVYTIQHDATLSVPLHTEPIHNNQDNHLISPRSGTAAADAKEAPPVDGMALPEDAKVCFFQTLNTTKLNKVVKLEAGSQYTVQVRCFSRALMQWSEWSQPVHTATQFPVVTRIVEIGTDYVHCTWDRAAQRSETGLARQLDVTTTNWVRSIPNFQLKFLRELDMAEHYFGSFESGCRSQTVRGLQPGTAYIVFARYMTMIHTMREWTEVTRLVTERPLEVHLVARGEDTFTFSWGHSADQAADVAATSRLKDSFAVDATTSRVKGTGSAAVDASLFDEKSGSPSSTTMSVAGYLQPRIPVHEYELTIESAEMRFDPVTAGANVRHHTVKSVCPSATYAVSVRALSEEGRWGGRSHPLVVRTADRPQVSVTAAGESFASFTWVRAEAEPRESQLQYRVQSVNSAYSQTETVALPAASATSPPARLLNVEHLRAGSDYIMTLRIAIDGVWGLWTEPLPFTTAASAALTFLERGEDFVTLNWPSSRPVLGARDDEKETPVYNIVVVKCSSNGERVAVLNERVTRNLKQQGFRVKDLEADTTYDVQCRTWQRNPMSGFEGWGEFSAPMRVQTLQPVALHVWDVGEDFIHVVWKRGLPESNGGGITSGAGSSSEVGGSDGAAGATMDWDRLKYEVVVGCVSTGEDDLLRRQVLDTSFTITQLKPSTTYTISVRACDEQGQWGLWSRVKVLTLASIKTTINEIGEDFVRLVWRRFATDDANVDLQDVTVADMFITKYSVLVYARELPGMPVVPHVQSGYEAGGGRSDVIRLDTVTSEHTSLRVSDLLPDREYVAVVRAATASNRWGLWSTPIRFRTNPPFRIPAHQLTIGENYVNVAWSRGDVPLRRDKRTATSEDGAEVQLGDLTVTGQELRIHGVNTHYVKEYALEPDLRELKVSELLPACAYTIQIRVRGRSGCWGLWSAPVHILTRGTIVVSTDEVAEDFIAVRWERRKVANPQQYPTGRGVVTSYHLRVYNGEGVHVETFLGDGDCPYRVTGLKSNTYYCVELKANYNDEEWGLWSVPMWCLTMQPMRIQVKLISEEFCCLQLVRPSQQRRLPEDDGNPSTVERVLAHGRVRPTIMLCVTSPIISKAPYNTTAAGAAASKSAYVNDALPPGAGSQRLAYQTELLNGAETVEHTIPNLKCNTVYSVSVRTKLANGEWGMWSPSLVFATVPATKVSFTSIGESFVGVEWVRHAQVIPPQIPHPDKVVLGVAATTASRVRVRESGGAYQHTYTVQGSVTSLRVDKLSPATTYMVCVQTFNDNYEWGVWSEEQKVRTVPGMEIHIQNVSEDALWMSWSRRTDLQVGGDPDTVFNVNISAHTYEVCILGEGGFTYTQKTTSTALFFRGLLPDAVYTVHVRAQFAQSDYWGLWSAQALRTKPRLRVTFGNIGDHFVMLEWRRHLPKPTGTELRLTSSITRGGGFAEDANTAGGEEAAGEAGEQSGARRGKGHGGDGAGHARAPLIGAEGTSFPIAETKDVVQLYRFKVQRVGEAHSMLYNIAPTVSSFRLRDLLPSSEYRVWVCAKGYEGVWGFWSEESRVRTLPRLQLEVQNIGEDYVRAQWRRGVWAGEWMAAEDGTEVRQVDGAVSGYEVRVQDMRGTVTTTGTTTFRETAATLSGLQLSSLYTIQVRAKDTYEAWGLWSDPVAFYTLKPVTVALQRVGENFAAVQWSRHDPLLLLHQRRSTQLDEDGVTEDEEQGMRVDENGAVHPDVRVAKWHMRVSCNRVFAGLPQSDDYRELYAEGVQSALQIDGLLPHATYAVTVRGLNHGGEWGHWSPPLYVSTCALLKVGVEMAGETFLQVGWKRPAARVGVTDAAVAASPFSKNSAGHQQHQDGGSSPHASADATRTHNYNAEGSNVNNHTNSSRTVSVAASESASRKRLIVSSGTSYYDEGADAEGRDDGDGGEDAEHSAPESLFAGVPESYLCFPLESEMHNYQVNIRPMPMEPAFDEADEPLVDGARVYETTQPGLRLGNLTPGLRYAITVREQQISEDGRPISGQWGAPSEVVCTQTVPPVQIIPQEIGEDYCVVEWRRASMAGATEDGKRLQMDGTVMDSAAVPTVMAAATTAGRKAIEYQLQTRRLEADGVTLYEGPLAFDFVVVVPKSVNVFHIPGLVSSAVYEVKVRAKIEGDVWGVWSQATSFLTQSRLQLTVDRVQEVTVRLAWERSQSAAAGGAARAPSAVAATAMSEDAEGDAETSSTARTDAALTASTAKDTMVLSASDAPGLENARPGTPAVGAHVILPSDVVREYEVVLEGISCEQYRRLQFGPDTQCVTLEDLVQNQLYCVSVRSLSEQQHWSHFSTKVTVLTLAPMQVRVAQYTESAALLEWHRPQPDIRHFTELLAREQREALQQCDERERRELFEAKRKVQEQESKGESAASAQAWVSATAREECNAVLRDEATQHYLADRIVVGEVECTGYELRLTLQDGTESLPYIVAVEQMRLRPLRLSKPPSTRDLLVPSRRGVPAGGVLRSFAASAFNGNNSTRDRKKEVTLKPSPPSPLGTLDATTSTAFATQGGGVAATAAIGADGQTGAGARENAVELLDVQFHAGVTQVLVRGLSPHSTVAAAVRSRSPVETWQPWCAPASLETLSLIQLDQSRFGEHYINLYWYRDGAADVMASAAQERAEYCKLHREFHNFSERDLEEQRSKLDTAGYTSMVNRLRRLRILQRLAAARARQHADGAMGLWTDPHCPILGFLLRVIDESGAITEHYIKNDAESPTLSFTATGLQPNNRYVCRLCPQYGEDVWGGWTAPLKYMTHNLIQLDLTYISETFVDLEWWRLDNKEVPKQDEHDTLLSSRYTEEAQVYQLRITHDDPETGKEVEEFRDMHATSVLRIDALLPDMKYTIAVREWDAKGDWGLWSAACSCVTLPSIKAAVSDVKECSAVVSWSRTAPRIDYESDMHVLEGNVETIGYYLKVEEVPLRRQRLSNPLSLAAESTSAAMMISAPTYPLLSANSSDSQPRGEDETSLNAEGKEASEETEDGVLSLTDGGTQSLHTTSFRGTSAVVPVEKPCTVDRDELEGTLALNFQRGGPLPPDEHPHLFDGLISDDAEQMAESSAMSPSKLRQNCHYLLVKKISSTDLQALLPNLQPQTVYRVQVMAVTTGGQLGPWSEPHFVVTAPRIQLSAPVIDEHYATLKWGRESLASVTAMIQAGGAAGNNAYAGGTNGAFPNERDMDSSGRSSRRASSRTAGAGEAVTLTASRIVAYELEVCGVNSDFTLTTRIDTDAPNCTYRVTGLNLNSVYTARARSYSETGEVSLWSAERTFVTLKPIVVRANEITEDHFDLEWGRPEQNPDHYYALMATSPFERDDVAAVASVASPHRRPSFKVPAAAATRSGTVPALVPDDWHLNISTTTRELPSMLVGARDAVKYHVRLYKASDAAPPQLLWERYLNGTVTAFRAESLSPNAIYVPYVRAVNEDGVWSEWSEDRCVYTMKPLLAKVATVGENFLRIQWTRDAPEELHYAPNTGGSTVAWDGTNDASSTSNQRTAGNGTNNNKSASGGGSMPSQATSIDPQGGVDSNNSSNAENAVGEGVSFIGAAATADSPDAAARWRRNRRFRLLDQAPPDVGPVYGSIGTSIVSFVVAVRRSGEAEDATVELPGNVFQYTLLDLQPDTVYFVSVRAKYGSGEMSPWSDVVRTGTYNLIATDVKEVGADYFAVAWQRKSNTMPVSSLHLGKVEDTICYELFMSDYSDVPLGEEDGELAQQRDREGRSLFFHPTQRSSVMGELQPNHRYRLSVRRWYQPHDGFVGDAAAGASRAGTPRTDSAVSPRGGLSRAASRMDILDASGAPAPVLAVAGDDAKVTIDAGLRESVERARAAPGVWSEADYVVTLRSMVCAVERVGEEFFQLRWARDPRAVPLPVRRAMPTKAVKSYQLRIDEMLRDGSGVDTTRSSTTLHLDEILPPTETTYFNKSLRPNTLYKVEVRCCIEKRWGRWSRPVYVITLPCLQVELSRIGEECTTIAWRRPHDPLTLPDGEVAFLGDDEGSDGTYQLEVSGVGFTYQVSKRLKASRTTYTVKHLDADALYAARVRWVDGVNQTCSLWSNTACFATLKPLQVQLTMPTEQFVNVEWSRPAQTAEEYLARMEQQTAQAAAVTSIISGNAAAAAVTAASGETNTPAPGRSVAAPPSAVAVQLGNPGALAFHLCIFNTRETPSVAVVDRQFHRDVSQFRVSGLAADTPYVVIIRACCEATMDWGLWSEERPFRTLKLLTPAVSSVGETYAELTWERGGDRAEALTHRSDSVAVKAAVQPTRYIIVVRSAQFGTVEREVTPADCGVTEDGYQTPSYRLNSLHPGTEYAVALQPCYGGPGDWGLWSQAARFTTLQPLQFTAVVKKDTVDLSWARQAPPLTTAVANFATNEEASVEANTDVAAMPSSSEFLSATGGSGGHGSVVPGTPALGSFRTVSKCQLVVCREADLVALQLQRSSLETSNTAINHSTSSLFPPMTASNSGGFAAALAPSPDSRPASGNADKGGSQRSAAQGPPDTPEAQALTAIPDMDVAELARLHDPAAASTAASIFLLRKQYDTAEIHSSSNANTAVGKGGGGINGGVSALSGDGGGGRMSGGMMVEHVEGLTPDTVYIARLRAMDFHGCWGTFVEQRFITPPPPPTQVVLRRVNVQFCSLQWAAVAVAPAPPSTVAETAGATVDGAAGGLSALEAEKAFPHYRYVVEQCYVAAAAEATVPVVAAAVASNNAYSMPNAAPGGGSTSGTRRKGNAAGGGIGAGPLAAASASTAGIGASAPSAAGAGGAEWHVVDVVEDTTVCAVRITGLLPRMRCRVRCSRRHVNTTVSSGTHGTAPTLVGEDEAVKTAAAASGGAPALPTYFFGPYSDYSEVVAVSTGTPPEGVSDLHLTTVSQNAATLEWLPPPKPAEAATGRYTRPAYRVLLANTSDQPNPVLRATVHRPTYALTNLSPSTTYTVQIIAENTDGVSFRNPILLFQTKSDGDTTVTHLDDGAEAEAAAAAGVLRGRLVFFHGPRALQQMSDDIPDIPSATRRLANTPTAPSSAAPKNGRRGGRAGKASVKKLSNASADPKKRTLSQANARASGQKEQTSVPVALNAPSRRSGSQSKRTAGVETVRGPSTSSKSQGGHLPRLSRTM